MHDDMDLEFIEMHHLARAHLAGLAQLHPAIHPHEALCHKVLAFATASTCTNELEQLVQFHMIAFEQEFRALHGPKVCCGSFRTRPCTAGMVFVPVAVNQILTAMERMLMILFTATLMMTASYGQGPTAPAAGADPREECLMATGADWARLMIDQDQIMRVNAIQNTCLQDCTAAKESGGDVKAVMDRHIAELRTVLTPDQFQRWSEWCAEKIGSKDK